MDVLDFALVEPEPVAPKLLMEEDGLRIEELVTCPYFETERITLPVGSEYFGLCDGATFVFWLWCCRQCHSGMTLPRCS